ncbi:MAG: methionine adenosyltransferase [Methylohalobius sp. ZOD2]
MNSQAVLFTSESVTPGHPDRLCDTMSDAIVDQFLIQDPGSRIVAECALSKGVVFIAARFASDATIDIPEVARTTIHQIGYDTADFDAEECTVITSLINLPIEERGAIEIELNEDQLDRIAARNQVTLFGFACNQTTELMPLPITLARQLSNRLYAAKQEGHMSYLSPDGTVQVGVELMENTPFRIHSLALTVGYEAGRAVESARLEEDVRAQVIEPAFSEATLKPDSKTRILINSQFVRSGPAAHSGMTGRKTASDTYGAYGRHSGSALSGKDPLRIDRTGAYAARYVAKNVVASELADTCEVQLSYALGEARPVSIQVETFGTGKMPDEEITRRINRIFDLRVGAIVRDFDLRHLPTQHPAGFYRRLPRAGHFGASFTDLPWERTDRVEALRE